MIYQLEPKIFPMLIVLVPSCIEKDCKEIQSTLDKVLFNITEKDEH